MRSREVEDAMKKDARVPARRSSCHDAVGPKLQRAKTKSPVP